jgi:hypothetical protein
MLDLLSRLWQRGPQAPRRLPSRPRPRYRPFVENLEERAVPATVTVRAVPSPGTPDAPISFPVVIASQAPGNTDLNGSFTLVDSTTGTTLDSRHIFSNASSGQTILAEFTVSAKLAVGSHTIVATFTSAEPSFEPSGSATITEVVKSPDVEVPPVITTIGFVHHKHLVKETLKVCAKSKTPVQGPFFLALANLNPAITLVNAAGKTVGTTPPGEPFVKLAVSSLSRKHCAKVTLIFDDPLPGKPSFTPVLLQTTGTP